jgi:hypothetical protein
MMHSKCKLGTMSPGMAYPWARRNAMIVQPIGSRHGQYDQRYEAELVRWSVFERRNTRRGAGGTGNAYGDWLLQNPREVRMKSLKASSTIRANKRKAKLKAKHRRQRARATG